MKEEEEAEEEEVSVVAALGHYCIVEALKHDWEEQMEVKALGVEEAAAAVLPEGLTELFVAVALFECIVECNYLQGWVAGIAMSVVAIVASELYSATPSTL